MVKYLPTYKKKVKIINFFNNKILDPTPLNRSFLPKEQKILKYLIFHIASSNCADTKQLAPQGLKTEFWSSENWAYNAQSVRNP